MNRITWVDNLRGLSILAIIFLHSTIAVHNNAGHFTLISNTMNEMLAPVRLGLMFFVSGLFVDVGLKKGLGPFINNKIKSILYPFIVWVAIYGGLKIVFSSMANTPQSPLNIILSHLTGGGDMTWFLHSLFIFFLMILVARKLPFYVVFLVCMFASWALPAIKPDSIFASFDNSHINKSFYLFVFFYLGDYVVRKQIDLAERVKKTSVIGLSLASFALLSCLNLFIVQGAPEALLSPLALLSLPFFVWIAAHLSSRIVYYIGTHSIVFYLSHYLAIQVFSKLVKFESASPWMNDIKFIAAFLAALALPWTICLMRSRGWLNFLFTLKKNAKPLQEKAV
ncbi:MAG: acyltransferase [Enterobacterales bacterium endosymbiont of Blomia tropicalis]|uniref:acyltransferase family protein n=1 Tax=Mixta mediterraneensis TaxID=2758443 RepID=UPI0025A73982|nr:acyltransferase [Mixta mediterraneensis]MDL4914167.1 acyltransferase [Mixta mediterraneensis]